MSGTRWECQVPGCFFRKRLRKVLYEKLQQQRNNLAKFRGLAGRRKRRIEEGTLWVTTSKSCDGTART